MCDIRRRTRIPLLLVARGRHPSLITSSILLGDLAPSGLVYVERNQCILHRKPEKDGLLEKGEARLHGVQNSRISDFVEGRQCPWQSIHETKGIYRPQGETLIKLGTRANVFCSLVRTNRSPGAGLARGRSNLQTPYPEAGYRACPPSFPHIPGLLAYKFIT